ncbi:hypothetical protein [Haloplanus natans]|uniref:hypothetical protein n=1 Tax=Haloplanus natans TaxID=376171 RepID=UPI000677C614|nr:hypothetical protein [Haloplanus natans]
MRIERHQSETFVFGDNWVAMWYDPACEVDNPSYSDVCWSVKTNIDEFRHVDSKNRDALQAWASKRSKGVQYERSQANEVFKEIKTEILAREMSLEEAEKIVEQTTEGDSE